MGEINLNENYYLVTFWSPQSKKNYATPKVRKDICSFLENKGVHIININPNNLNKFEKDLEKHYKNSKKMNKNFGTIIQYPLKPIINIDANTSNKPYKFLDIINKFPNYKIVIIHDIKSIQSSMFEKSPSSNQLLATQNIEETIFSNSNALIVHSKPMKVYVSSKFNIKKKKIHSLEVFDYTGLPIQSNNKIDQNINIAFAGYLGISKKKLLDQLFYNLPNSSNIFYNLYGSDFPKQLYQRKDIKYNGSIIPEKLPRILNENNNFGLVWDEFNSLQRKYYKFIFPHKGSLYLRSLLPLIVPSNTYIGDFIKLNHLGITIDKLSDIEMIDFNNLKIDYEKLESIQKKMNLGYFIINAITRSLQ
jgi:hypothetical protein